MEGLLNADQAAKILGVSKNYGVLAGDHRGTENVIEPENRGG